MAYCQQPRACMKPPRGPCRCRTTPAQREEAAARMKALHADPEFKARMKARNADPEFRAQAAARMKALQADPDFRAKMKARRAHVALEVPRWVPEALVDEFLDAAALYGEEAAAALVRRLKRETGATA